MMVKATSLLILGFLLLPPAEANEKKILFTCAYPESLPLFQQVKAVYKAAFSNMGYDFDMIPVTTSKRSLQDSKKGVIDGECGRTADLPELVKETPLMRVDVLLITTEFGIWGRQKGLGITPDELNHGNYNLAYYAGSLILERYIQDHRLSAQKVVSTELGFRMLSVGRFDLFLVSSEIAYQQVLQLGLTDEIVKVGVLSHEKIYPYIHSKHQSLIPRLTEELKRLIPPEGLKPTYNLKNDLQKQTTGHILTP